MKESEKSTSEPSYSGRDGKIDYDQQCYQMWEHIAE